MFGVGCNTDIRKEFVKLWDVIALGPQRVSALGSWEMKPKEVR